jgi:hypothetical protein
VYGRLVSNSRARPAHEQEELIVMLSLVEKRRLLLQEKGEAGVGRPRTQKLEVGESGSSSDDGESWGCHVGYGFDSGSLGSKWLARLASWQSGVASRDHTFDPEL